MLQIKIEAAKRMFFDRRAVLSAVDRGTRRVLSKFGAYVRTRARTSIRKGNMSKRQAAWRKAAEARQVKDPTERQKLLEESYALHKAAASKPGDPPKSWNEHLLRNMIFFVFEPQRRSVLIGPTKLNGGSNAPEVLEHGGNAVHMARFPQARRTIHVAARPFMRPALERELPQLPAMWKDAVK